MTYSLQHRLRKFANFHAGNSHDCIFSFENYQLAPYSVWFSLEGRGNVTRKEGEPDSDHCAPNWRAIDFWLAGRGEIDKRSRCAHNPFISARAAWLRRHSASLIGCLKTPGLILGREGVGDSKGRWEKDSRWKKRVSVSSYFISCCIKSMWIYIRNYNSRDWFPFI